MGSGGATQVLGLAFSCQRDPPQTPLVTAPPLVTAAAEAAPLCMQTHSKATSPSPAPRSVGTDLCPWHTVELYGTHRSLLPIASNL